METFISVIIATHNRPENLEKVLWALFNQDKPSWLDYEILVIDNNSTPTTEELINRLQPKAKGRLKYHKQTLRGKSNALNMGIEKSQGEIIAFTDDDVQLNEKWLSAMAEGFQQYDCDGLGGRVLPVFPENTPLWVRENPYQAAGAVVIYDQGEAAFPADRTTERFIGSNWAFKKSVFKECGMFNPDLGPGTAMMGEDEEFYFRLLRGHKRLYYCPEVLVQHPVDLKRLSLKFAAEWNLTLGRYQAYKQMQEGANAFKCWFGAPRYIFKEMMVNLFKLIISCGNRLAFWNAYRRLFCYIGMIQQYQRSR